jgi:hypothetical protein
MGRRVVMLFVGNIVAKLVIDLIGIAAGSTTSAVGKSLPLTFGLTLLGEAVVLWMRTGGATGLLNPPRASTAQPRRSSTARSADVTPDLEPSPRYTTADQANAPAPSRDEVGCDDRSTSWQRTQRAARPRPAASPILSSAITTVTATATTTTTTTGTSARGPEGTRQWSRPVSRLLRRLRRGWPALRYAQQRDRLAATSEAS